jgi:hypothetical protein
MREPETDKEKFLARRIDSAGEAILNAGITWEDGVLKFSHPYESLTQNEQQFIDQLLTEWKIKVSKKG